MSAVDPIAPGKRKLFVLVREDLPAGYQAVQGLHAAVNFQHCFPERAKKWFDTSNTVIMLGVPGLGTLRVFQSEANRLGLKNVLFWEPDIASYTALCIEPSVKSEWLVSRLPLLLRPKGLRGWWKRNFS